MPKKTLISALVLYVVSAVASYGAFSYFQGTTNSVVVSDQELTDATPLGELLQIDPSAAKDQVCPLNGGYFTDVERQAWEKRRPLAVMIENTPDARPQSGLSRADVVFEAVAEGGVTRFMAMFYCNVQAFDTTLAPIRSARTYYVDYASGFNRPLYVHVGGANVPGPTDALGQLSEYGWVGENDLNQFSIGYPTFVRDYNRVPGKEIATEHTMVTTTEALWEVGEDRGWTNISPDQQVGRRVIEGSDWKDGYDGWEYEEEAGSAGSVSSVAYDFWSGYGDYSVSWQYDAQQDAYLRTHGGEAHTDLNNDERVAAKNVIVLLTTEKGPINEKKHMLYGTTGTGEALLFKHGEVEEVTWVKQDRESELQFRDSRGNDIPLARGLTWISVVSDVTEVKY